MNGRKRIQKVMNLEIPDKVPFDGLMPFRSDFLYLQLLPSKRWQPEDSKGIYPNVHQAIMKMRLWRWRPKNWTPPMNWQEIPRVAVDEFGCLWDYTKDDVTKGHPTGGPLKDWNMLDDWEFPDPYDPTRYRLAGLPSKIFLRKYIVGTLDSFLFARLQYLRGFTKSLVDLRRNKDHVHALMDKLKDYYIGTVEMWAKKGCQAITAMDDMGAQHELFINPKLYKEFIAEPFREIMKRIHELDMKFILHSCGHVNELMPIWVDIGVDALQFDAPRMTGLEYDAKFTNKFCFLMVPDIQKVYPFATVEELEKEIKEMIKLIGSDGGLVIRDYYGARKVLHVPDENYKALPKFVKKWGKYPLDW